VGCLEKGAPRPSRFSSESRPDGGPLSWNRFGRTLKVAPLKLRASMIEVGLVCGHLRSPESALKHGETIVKIEIRRLGLVGIGSPQRGEPAMGGRRGCAEIRLASPWLRQESGQLLLGLRRPARSA